MRDAYPVPPDRPGTTDIHHTDHPGGPMFEDQHVELLPARTTMQTITVTGEGGAGGAGGAGGFAAAASAALNLVDATQTASAGSVFGDAAAVNVAATGDATAGD